MTMPSTARELISFKRYKGEVVRVEASEYMGKRFINLRKWYTGPDGTLRPTKEGVSIKFDELRALVVAMGTYYKDEQAVQANLPSLKQTVSTVVAQQLKSDDK